MQSVTITLNQPISQFVSYRSRDQKVQPRETVMELVTLGFETLLKDHYQRYRRGEISLGRLAQELGVTSWELTHLLEGRDWPVYNLPEAD